MSNTSVYDVVVIGAGMGGLTAGTVLAQKGLKVLLLEKEKQVGGYVVSFQREGFTFDATGAFVGGCSEGGEFWQILKEMKAHEEVDFIPIHHIRNVYPGFEVELRKGGFDFYLEALSNLFPEEKKGLKTYLSLVRRIGDEIKAYSGITPIKKILFPFYFRNLMRFRRVTHGAILDGLFKGQEIKMALHTLPVTDPPSRLSFLLVATLISKALMEGVFYPKGGMGKISEAIARSFLRSGGEISLQTEADRILVKNGKIEGVETKDGKIIRAKRVISNVSPNLLVTMLPPEGQERFTKEMSRLEYSQSCFILYIATDLDLARAGFPYFTFLRFLSDLEEEDRAFRRGEIPKNPTMIMTVPTLLDPSLAPTGSHLIKVLVTAPYGYEDGWGGGDPLKYQRIKGEFSRKILRQLESKLIPHLQDHLFFWEAATPLTLKQYTGNQRGSMYGLASTPEQIGNLRPSHSTPIRGLFRVGHYTRPSHGIVGASLSGLFAARTILYQMHRA